MISPARVFRLALIVVGVAQTRCAAPDPGPDAAARGAALYDSGQLSASTLNRYSCATCHDLHAPSAVRKPGALMAGATQRTSFWGGQQNDLLAAINDCRAYFMVANEPLEPRSPMAADLDAYLESLEPGPTEDVAFSVVRRIEPIARGDAERGEELYATSCGYCHGAAHTGAGRLSERVTILPEETNAEHAELSLRVQRIVFIEKVRHGAFLGYGGDMPPFSLEVLSDAELADILEFMGVLGE
jgi:thiosulfate dehydrogenase